jgi:hypothetical protein
VTGMQGREAVWRPYEDDPLFVPQVLLGFDALEPEDADRLCRYLAALVAQRCIVHIAVAFNAVYFGYDLGFGGYVGGPVDFDRFEQVRFGETTAALPVGAMVNIAAGAHPLYAEVTYKEGAHPQLGSDGDVPAWLSGAPARAAAPEKGTEPGAGTVLAERLVIDCDAFGKSLVASQAQWDRLRRRSKWLDNNGHLLLHARYESADDAETDDVEFYARYLLTRARGQFLAGPLPLLLSDEATEEQLAAALRASLGTIEEALRSVSTMRIWRGYAFSRSSLADRLTSHSALGRDDLISLAVATSRSGSVAHRRFAESDSTARYTAIGPLLGTVNGAAQQLAGLGYPVAVCHANAVFGDYATRAADDGVLPSGTHLRLDDAWQGGGIWRASSPPGPYANLDPLVPLGLGWAESPPPVLDAEETTEPTEPETSNGTEPHDEPCDSAANLLSVTDSHISWTVPLRLAHILIGVAVLPKRAVEEFEEACLVESGIRLLITHDGYGLSQEEADQAIVVTHADGRTRLTGIEWPLEFFPGIVLTFSWQRGSAVLRAHSTLLEAPVTIDGIEYEHRYSPGILTRDTAPGCPRRGGSHSQEPLTLRERILRAVRQAGHLDPNGVAVLRSAVVADIVYGHGAGPAVSAALQPAIDALVSDSTLASEKASLGAHGLQWPAEATGELVPVLVWQPKPVVGRPRHPGNSQGLSEYVVEYSVAPFLRKLPPGSQASEEKRAQYRLLVARYGQTADLPLGYTLVSGHTRHR